MIKKLLLIFFLLTSPAWAGTYYIGPNGDYATFAAFKSAIPTPAVSSDVYFECGNTFGFTAAWSLNWQGTEADRAVIGAYYYSGGSKVIGVSGTKPIISGQNYVYPTGTIPVYSGLIQATDKDYVTIQNLWVKESRGSAIRFIGGAGDSNVSSKYFIVEDCDITDNYMSTIEVAYCNDSYGIIRRNYSYNNVLAGGRKLKLYANHPINIMIVGCPNSNIVIEDNTVIQNYGEQVGGFSYDYTLNTSDTTHLTIRNNYIGGVGQPAIYLDGISYADVYGNKIVPGNYSSASGSLDGINFAGTGISINNETYPDGVINPGNLDQVHHINVYNNFIASGNSGIGVGDETKTNKVDNIKIYNNTIIACAIGFDLVGSAPVFTNCEFKNNVLYTPTGTVSTIPPNQVASTSGWTHANNAGNIGSSYGTNYVTISDSDVVNTLGADWQTITLAELLADEISESYFNATSGSNLIDAGATIAAVTTDYYGTARPTLSAYDIGGHEYNDFPNHPPTISGVRPGNVTIYSDDLAVTFASDVTDSDGDAVTVVWDMGDAYATNQTEQDPGALTLIDPSTYPTNYVITLTATDAQGLSNSTSFTIQVLESEEEGEVTCQEFYNPGITADTNGPQVGAYNTQEFVGGIYQPASNQSVCSVDLYVRGKTGSPSGTLYLRWFTINGSNQLASVVATSNGINPANTAAGSWLSSNAGIFTFATPVSLTSGTKYGWGVFRDTDSDLTDDPETDNASFIVLGHKNTGNTDDVTWGRYHWTHSASLPYVVQQSDATDDVLIKVHTQQETPTTVTLQDIVGVTASGTYKQGDSITVALQFNLPVALTDANSNATKNMAVTGESGDGTDIVMTHSAPAFAVETSLHFYTGLVPAGATTSDLTIISIDLNGDAIGGATLDIPSGHNLDDNADIIFDTSQATIGGFYACDADKVQITAATSIAVPGINYLCLASDGDNILFADGPLLNLEFELTSTPAVTAKYYRDIGTDVLQFYYLVESGMRGTDIGVSGTDQFTHGATKLTDAGGNEIDYTLPNTWLIDANSLDLAVPKSPTYGTAWVIGVWADDKPTTVVPGDHFIIMGNTDTVEVTGTNLTIDLPDATGEYTIDITGSGNVLSRPGQTVTMAGDGALITLSPWRF